MMPSPTITVPDDSESVRLDRFLVSVLPRQSRSQIQRLIKDGHIRVDGREAKANQPVKTGSVAFKVCTLTRTVQFVTIYFPAISSA